VGQLEMRAFFDALQCDLILAFYGAFNAFTSMDRQIKEGYPPHELTFNPKSKP